ncbi:GLPGLI family protein [Aquimarina sp. LLG6339-5]|uniref:GLPGLI family protein n=1 Tax=Aquimarina sp. LLG6339-5 TaxID=3160830 RepID=UPI0038635B5C
MNTILKVSIFLLFSNYFLTAQTFEIGYKEYYSLAGHGLNIVKEEINNSKEKITPDFILRYRDGESIYIKTEDLPLYDKLNSSDPNKYPKLERVSSRYKNHKTKELLLDYKNYRGVLYGKDILVKDSLPNYEWKLSEKTQNIFGFNCKSAETINEYGKKVLVWFTSEVPIKAGPRSYWGLPGLIVQVEIGNQLLIFTTYTNQLNTKPPIRRPFQENILNKEDFILLKEKLERPRTVKLKNGEEVIIKKGN